jgi:integral membrane protein
MSTTQAFRWVAIAEATSWLLLIAATAAKYYSGNQVGVHVLGPIHGVLFLGYVLLAVLLRFRLGWSAAKLLVVLADSILPGGGYLVARWPELREPARR